MSKRPGGRGDFFDTLRVREMALDRGGMVWLARVKIRWR